MSEAYQAMKRWKCHKEVWAEKIAGIREFPDGSILLQFTDGGGLKTMDGQWANKHKPEVGGYYVVYGDGYVSYSPAKAFEEGYSRV